MNKSEKLLCEFISELSVSYATMEIVDMTNGSPGYTIPFFGSGPTLWLCFFVK